METDQNPPLRIGVLKLAGALLSLVILVVSFRNLASFLQPLFIAVFFFYASQPLTNLLIKKRVPSFFAYLIPIALVILIFSLLGWFVGSNVDTLIAQFPIYKQRLQGTYQTVLKWVFETIPFVGERLQPLLSGQKIPMSPLEKFLKAFVGNVFGFFTFGLLVIFFLIFIMQEARTLPNRLKNAYGDKRAGKILQIGRRINTGIIQYIYVKTMASATVGGLSAIAILGFNIDLAILWSVLIFFGNYIPYVGSAVAVVFPIVICVLQYGSLAKTLILGGLLVIFQVFVGNYLEPRVAGRQLNLSPLLVLLSLAFWGWLWGMVGLVVAIPVMMSVRIILENIPSTHQIALLMSHVGKTSEKKATST